MKRQLQVHGALTFVSLIYGANYSIAKIATPEYIGPFGFITVRVIISTALFWLIASFFPADPIKDRRDYWQLAKCALFGVATNQLFFFKGLSLTSPIHGSLIITTVPIIVLVVSRLLLKETITRTKIIGIALGFSGAIALILNEGISLDNDIFLGDVFIFLNAIAYGTYLVIVRPLMQRYSALTLSKWVFFFGIFMVTPFGYNEAMAVTWNTLPQEAWLSIAFVIVGTTLIVYALNAWTLKYVKSATVGSYIYLQPVFATIIAILLEQDEFDPQKLIFALFIFCGVYMVSKGK